MSDLNLIGAAQVARVADRGGPRRGREQGELDLVADGAVAIRDGPHRRRSARPPRSWPSGAIEVPTLDVSGATVLPGLIECHSHPLFAGSRHAEYAERLGGASLAEVAARGGGIWASVVSTRAAGDRELAEHLEASYGHILRGGVTTLEVKSGYGLEAEQELRQLELLARSRASTPIGLVISFLGAHVVPAGTDADAYTDEVLAMLVARARAGDRGVSRHHRRARPVHARAGAEDVRALPRAGRSRPAPTRMRGPARRAGRPPSVAGRSRPST